MMKKKHSVKFNAIMNILLTSSTMLLSVVTIPYVTRTLSVEGYGNVNFAQSISSWLSALCLVGVPSYAVRACARVRDDPVALARVVKEMLIIISVFTAIVLGAFGICIFFIPRLASLASLMWVFLVSTLILSYGVEWYFQAVEQYEYIAIRSIVFKVLAFIAIIAFVRNSEDWFFYGVILALGTCGNNLFNLVRLIREIPLTTKTKVNPWKHFKSLGSYAILSISSAIYMSFDSVILGMVSANNIQVALYQLAAKIKGLCWSVVNSIVGVLIPRLSYYAKNSFDKFDGLAQRGFYFLLNICLALMFYLLVFAEPLVVLVSSNKYSSATTPVQIIGIVNLFSCMSYYLSLCILSPLDRERKIAEANIIGVPISLVLNLCLDSKLGAIGAALSILAAEAVIFMRQAYASCDVLSRILQPTKILRAVFAHIGAFIIILILSFVLERSGVDYLATSTAAVAVISGVIVYAFAWLFFALCLHEETSKWMIGIIRDFFQR